MAKNGESLETRLAKAQLEALKVRMNPHFIANALTSIRSMMYRDEKEAAIEYLTLFARLIRKTLENAVLELISLSDEIKFTENYLKLEKLRFGDKFEASIVVSSDLKEDEIMVPPGFFQPFIENSINHGLMHMSGGGKLDISFDPEDKLLKCTIQDNGIGRQRARELRTNSASRGSPLSEKIAREQMKLYNILYNTTDFRIETTDLADSRGKPAGTKVVILMPVLKN